VGVLPTPLRGDAETLPALGGLSGPELDAYVRAERDASALEERRLGYVAFTRPRQRLIASASWWGPTQKLARGPSAYLDQVREHCLAGGGEVAVWTPPPADGEENPLRGGAGETWAWPAPLEPDALARRRAAAERVAELRARPEELDAADRPPELDAALDAALDGMEAELVGEWDRDVEVLLAELRRARVPLREVPLPGTLATTQLLRVATDPRGLARDLARPMPRPPVTAARRGTAFHAWVEARFAQQPLLAPDDVPGAADAGTSPGPDADELAELQRAFLATPYADLAPLAVEAPFEVLLGDRVIRGRIDAVYRTADGDEVVDWKTGEGPADPLQLAVYRLAWAELHGLEPEDVRASFLHVRSGRVDRPHPLPGRRELERLLARAVARQPTSATAK